MTAYNINNVAKLMNEDAAKYNTATGKFDKNEEFMPGGGHVSPSIPKNVQPVKFQRNAAGKTEKVSDGSGKGKGKGNPFAKKDGKKGNPFAKKGKKGNPFAKKDGKKENPFAKGGSVDESIDRLLYLLEASDQNGMSEEEAHAELERRINALPPKYVRSANPGPALAAQLASSERTKAHLARTAGSGAVCRACGQKILPGGRHDYPSQR